jgi:hypothetical protein
MSRANGAIRADIRSVNSLPDVGMSGSGPHRTRLHLELAQAIWESVKFRGQPSDAASRASKNQGRLTPLSAVGAGKLVSCRIVHSNTLLQFAPGILHSPYRQTLQAVMRNSYRSHYRRMLPALLDTSSSVPTTTCTVP